MGTEVPRRHQACAGRNRPVQRAGCGREQQSRGSKGVSDGSPCAGSTVTSDDISAQRLDRYQQNAESDASSGHSANSNTPERPLGIAPVTL
jgi:hypothetical protein